MRIAIIGAGIAGLACAGELERLGFAPVIYETQQFIGNAYPHVAAWLEITHRPIKNVLKHFNKKFAIDIKPISDIKTIVHNSPSNTTVIRGKLGYLFKNNREPDCTKMQLYGRLKKTVIKLDTFGDYEQLEKEFDRVVIATGGGMQAQELGCWQSWVDGYVRGACVAGNFDPSTVVMWINKDYCKNGYAYLTPFSRNRAALVLVLTDVNGREADNYWSIFLDAENIKYEIIETFKLQHDSGYVYPLVIGKIIFAGNAAGGLEPFLGFGMVNAITMGVAAARTIATGKSYEKQIKDVLLRNKQMRCFREAFNTLTNKEYDNLVSFMGLPGIKQFLYNTRINVPSIGALICRLLTKNKC